MNIHSAQIRILLLVFVLLTNTVLLAQVETVSDSYTDSTQSPNYMPVFEGLMMNYKTGNPKWQEVDTTLELFSDFDKAYNQRFYSATLGNIGQSHRVLDYEFEPFGIRFKKIPLPNYIYSEQNVPIFKPNSPYTVVSYVAGSNKHHLLSGVHAQEINNFSLGATFNVISCLGAYQQQRTSVAGASAYLAYHNDKGNYNVLFSYFFNQLKLNQNGGLADDSLFVFNVEPFRGGMPVNLQKTSNEFVQNHFELTQTYAPFFKKDSLQQIKNQWLVFSHSIKYDKQKWIFLQEELDSVQSQSALINPLFTKDSLAGHILENRLEWQTNLRFPLFGKNVKLNTAFGINHTLFSVGDSISRSTDNYYGLHAHGNLGVDSVWQINYQGEQVLGGWSSGAFSQGLDFSIFLWKNHKIQFDILFRSLPQTYFSNSFNGNFYQWKNDFSRLNEKKIGLVYSILPISVGVEAFQVSNFVFLNQQSLPEIHPSNIEFVRLWSEINLKYRFLRSQTKLTYHQNNASQITMFPDYVARQKLFAVFHMFKNAMLANAGVEGVYVPEYNGAYYNPNLFDFYLNNSQKIGNFFYLDVFIGFKVKRFNFMVKMLNAPQGLLPYDYFSTPSYPLPDRQFRLGVSWRFYD